MTAGMTFPVFAEEAEQMSKGELEFYLSLEGTRGDITGNGKVNVFDVMRYKKSILNGDNTDISGKTDINRNGMIDGSDVSAVKSSVLGASVLWSYDNVPKMESNLFSDTFESVFRSSMLGLKYSDAKTLASDDNESDMLGNLISGDTDLVFTDAVSEEAQKAAAEAVLKLNIVPVAKYGLVFIVNKNNPVDSLTSDQIKDIYSGKITNWKEVGGNDELIVPFQRNDNSDSQKFMNKWMNGKKLTEPLKIGDVNSEYRNLENAIGFTCYSNAAQMGEESSDIKYIAVDGVKPSAETMNDGTYPVVSSIYAVYTNKTSQKTRKFAAWLLSEDGQNKVADSGCVPVKKSEQQVGNKLYTAKGTGKEKPADLVPDWNGFNIFLYESEGGQKLSWKDGMPKNECGLTCLKDKDVQEKINSDIRHVMFGDKDFLPGEWKMKVEVFNAYMNIKFCKNGSDTAAVKLIYDLRDGTKLEKFSDLFYKDTDFLPLLNRVLERVAAKDDKKIFITDYFGLSDDITQFDFNYITLGENNPYSAGTLDLPLQDSWTREMMGHLVISEPFISRDLFEEGVSYKGNTRMTEWSTNEWIKDFSYGSDGKLHHDFISYYHTPDEIEKRNHDSDLVFEKARDLYVKEFPDAAGKYRIDDEHNLYIEDPETGEMMVQVNAFWASVSAGKDHPKRYYYFDPETTEQIRLSDILGKDFEAYNDQYYVGGISFNAGTVSLYRFTADSDSADTLTVKFSLDDLNMKYVRLIDSHVTELSAARNGIVDSENALVYPESYVVKHDHEKKGEPVQKGYKVQIRNYTESLGEMWYECWNAENGDYCGWIAKDDLTVQYTDDQNKIKFSSFEEQPIYGDIVPNAVSYTNESVMDPDSELKECRTFDKKQFANARNKCLSHGKWLYECWYANEYIGWVEMHDFQIGERSWEKYDDENKNSEKLESERTGTVPGEKYNGIDFYAPKYIVYDTTDDKSAGCVREDIKIKTDTRCEFHGEWWYECVSAKDGTYLGWVNGDLIEFE
jgi:ABC-type Fe3+ transport system substrate-binding protein